MTAADVINLLLEMDQQWCTSRPSPCGLAAEIVYTLCEHAEPSYRKDMGNWRACDIGAVRRPATHNLDQPTMEKFGL